MEIEDFGKWAFAEVALLALAFIAGMGINLFVNMPSNANTAAFWGSGGAWVARIHMFLGTLILAAAIVLFINARKFRYMKQDIKTPSLVGLISVAVAFAAGLIFLFAGADSIFSYVMALGFLFAIIIYVLLLSILVHGRRQL